MTCYMQSDLEMFSVCVTPEEAKHSPGETPAFTFIWSELQSPSHL